MIFLKKEIAFFLNVHLYKYINLNIDMDLEIGTDMYIGIRVQIWYGCEYKVNILSMSFEMSVLILLFFAYLHFLPFQY